MKKYLIVMVVLALSGLACSLFGVIDKVTGDETIAKSEGRCGDGVCDGPENDQICPQDCSPEQAQGSFSRQSPPEWFSEVEGCTSQKTSVRSEGSPWAFDSQGYTTELLSDGQITCVLEIQICGYTIFKQQVIDAGDECPAYLHYSYAPPTPVCCSTWDESKQSGSPCDPLQDADCDGVSNDEDPYPLDFSQR